MSFLVYDPHTTFEEMKNPFFVVKLWHLKDDRGSQMYRNWTHQFFWIKIDIKENLETSIGLGEL